MFGIICDARKGKGIRTLALVDRSRSKRLWWTSDNANIAMCYRKRDAADFAAARLKKNRARVVNFADVQDILTAQKHKRTILEVDWEHERDWVEGDRSWDAHKSY